MYLNSLKNSFGQSFNFIRLSFSYSFLSLVKDAINDEKVKHIIMFENDTLTDEVEKIISDNNIEKIYFDSLTTLSSENQTSGKDYLSVMNSNLEILKKELYKSE